jgi:hypothetical protein
MNTLHKYLLPLVAVAAVAGAQPASAQWSGNGNQWNNGNDRNDRGNEMDREKVQRLVNQLQNRVDRDKLQALLNQIQTNGQFDRTKLQALAAQIMAALKERQNGGGGSTPSPGAGGGTSAAPKTLVLYDAPSGTPWDKLGFAYAIMLRNLLGHFDAQVDLVPVQQYTAGRLLDYTATFYLGSAYDHQIPAAFLADAAVAAKPVVWFKYNLWQLAGNAAYNFTPSTGIQSLGLRGLNAVPTAANTNPGFFDTVKYKNLDFVKYYNYDAVRNLVNADPDIGHVAVIDAAKAAVVVPVVNPKTSETAPYVVRAGNFWYVADLPFSFIGPRDRYLVFSDLLHDIMGSNHAQEHKGLIRLEDVGALVSVDAMKKLTDYMAAKRVPFSVAVIPRYVDGPQQGRRRDGDARLHPPVRHDEESAHRRQWRRLRILEHRGQQAVPGRFALVGAGPAEPGLAGHAGQRPVPGRLGSAALPHVRHRGPHRAAAVHHHLPARRLLHGRQARLLRRHQQGLQCRPVLPVRDQKGPLRPVRAAGEPGQHRVRHLDHRSDLQLQLHGRRPDHQREVRQGGARRVRIVLLPSVLAGTDDQHPRARGFQEDGRGNHAAGLHLGRAQHAALNRRQRSL